MRHCQNCVTNTPTTTAGTWLLFLLVLSLGIMEINGGMVMRKLRELKARCREKFQSLRLIYKLWSNVKNKQELDPTDGDFNQLANKVDQFMNMDSDTIARRFDDLRASGGLKNAALNKMFDTCARQMGNTSNLVNEMKKHMKHMQNLNNRNMN